MSLTPLRTSPFGFGSTQPETHTVETPVEACMGLCLAYPPETAPSSMKSHQSKPLTHLQAHVHPDAETLSNLISQPILDHLSISKRVR